jgi:serine protease Do
MTPKSWGYDSTNDVALLKIDATGLTAAPLGDSDSLNVGDEVAAIGNPLGELDFTMTVGYISALDRVINTDGTPINMLQTDAAINSGNSGGPLFDMHGNVVGITTAKYSGSTTTGTTIDGLGFAIPINDVKAIVSDLMKYGYVDRSAV